MIDLATYQPQGDKENSAFFWEYLPKIYERRAASGVDDLVGDMAAVLDPANFDAAKINALIDGSSLSAEVKTTLKTAVDGAAKNPSLVEAAINQVKTALGM